MWKAHDKNEIWKIEWESRMDVEYDSFYRFKVCIAVHADPSYDSNHNQLFHPWSKWCGICSAISSYVRHSKNGKVRFAKANKMFLIFFSKVAIRLENTSGLFDCIYFFVCICINWIYVYRSNCLPINKFSLVGLLSHRWHCSRFEWIECIDQATKISCNSIGNRSIILSYHFWRFGS